MIYPKLVSVKPMLPSDLLLAYADGSERRFACSAYLDRGVFVRLKDPALFAQAHVAGETVCWPGGLDIAPETLFLRSSLIKQSSEIAN